MPRERTAEDRVGGERHPLEMPAHLAADDLVLHICCAVCGCEPVEALLEQGSRPTLFFCNHNLDTRLEYELRKNETIRLARRHQLPWHEEAYSPDLWSAAIRGLEHTPERGARCEACFLMRLQRTAAFCAQRGIPFMATTLGISPHKDLEQVHRAGTIAAEQAGITYWPVNWRKRGGVERMFRIARRDAIYHQNYCGCSLSRAERDARA